MLNQELQLRKDAALVRRAMRGRWAIGEADRERLVRILLGIAADEDNSDTRARVNAARAIIEADKLNLESERLELDRDKFARGDGSNVSVNVNVNGMAPLTREQVKQLSDSELAERLSILDRVVDTTGVDSGEGGR